MEVFPLDLLSTFMHPRERNYPRRSKALKFANFRQGIWPKADWLRSKDISVNCNDLRLARDWQWGITSRIAASALSLTALQKCWKTNRIIKRPMSGLLVVSYTSFARLKELSTVKVKKASKRKSFPSRSLNCLMHLRSFLRSTGYACSATRLNDLQSKKSWSYHQ
jgi:hypothetical protein